jgi:hypothetical protein
MLAVTDVVTLKARALPAPSRSTSALTPIATLFCIAAIIHDVPGTTKVRRDKSQSIPPRTGLPHAQRDNLCAPVEGFDRLANGDEEHNQ